MGQRRDFHNVLRGILGGENVYYQPPPGFTLQYPAIVYSLNGYYQAHADNEVYRMKRSYSVQVLALEPDHPAVDRLAALPESTYSAHFASDGVTHDTFRVYY